MGYWSIGVLECWGKRKKPPDFIIFFTTTPLLHHSNTPFRTLPHSHFIIPPSALRPMPFLPATRNYQPVTHIPQLATCNTSSVIFPAGNK